jgi:hypothetical protein
MSRRFHPRRRQHLDPTSAAIECLGQDYHEALKTRIFLSAKGVLRGSRQCLFCRKPGVTSKLFIPQAARRIDEPDFSGVQGYWVCPAHQEAPTDDSEVPRRLAARRAARAPVRGGRQ